MDLNWDKMGCLLSPDTSIHWLYSSVGASFALPSLENRDIFNIYVTGRDNQGRSLIGLVKFDMSDLRVLEVAGSPVMELGEKGAFDENGTSYPSLVKVNGLLFMYYTGWVQGVQVPWINGLGLATTVDGQKFKRYSRAPIFHRDNNDFIGIGSSYIIRDEEKFKMWYTRFEKWGQNSEDHKHYYNIKYAESDNGIDWTRTKKICIDFKDDSEYAISKPCVLKWKDKYLMWYSYRGDVYKIGLAVSANGIDWVRKDELAGIDRSKTGWDSEMVCYPFVFPYKGYLYMLYNGNGYGASGLGLARLPITKLTTLV